MDKSMHKMNESASDFVQLQKDNNGNMLSILSYIVSLLNQTSNENMVFLLGNLKRIINI